jgi:hypothetical protein
MIAILIDGKIRVESKLPRRFGKSLDYRKKDPQEVYTDGWRDLVEPSLTDSQELGNLYFDSENDVFTYNIIDLNAEDLVLKNNLLEYDKYIIRERKGKEKYLKLCGEFRLSRDRGNIDQSFYELLEDTLEPVRTELFLGQFITAKRKLVAIGSTDITQEIYDRFFNSLSDSIEELY